MRASVEPRSSIPPSITAPARSFFDTRVLNTAGLDLTSAVRDHTRDTRPDNQNVRPSQPRNSPRSLPFAQGRSARIWQMRTSFFGGIGPKGRYARMRP